MKLAWRNHAQPLDVRLAVEVGRTHYGRWFAYINIRNRNYWLRRY